MLRPSKSLYVHLLPHPCPHALLTPTCIVYVADVCQGTQRDQRERAEQELADEQRQVTMLRQRQQKYLDQIAQLQRQLEELGDDSTTSLALSKAQRDLSQATREADDARDALRETKEAHARELADARRATNDAVDRYQDAESTIERLREELDAARERADADASDLATGDSERAQELQRQLGAADDQVAKLNAQLAEAKEREEALQEELEALREVSEARVEAIEAHEAEAERRQRELEGLRRLNRVRCPPHLVPVSLWHADEFVCFDVYVYSRLCGVVAVWMHVRWAQDLQGQVEALESRVDGASSEVANDEVDELQAQLRELQSKLDHSEDDHVQTQRTLGDMVSQLREELAASRDELKTAQRTVIDAETLAAQRADRIRELEEELATVRDESSHQQRELATAQRELEDTRRRLERAMPKIEAAAAMEEKLETTEDDLDLARARISKLQHDIDGLHRELKAAHSVRPKQSRLTPVGRLATRGSFSSPRSMGTDDSFAPDTPQDAAASPRGGAGDAPARPSDGGSGTSGGDALSGTGSGSSLGRRLPSLSSPPPATSAGSLPPVSGGLGKRAALPPTPGSGNSGAGGFRPDSGRDAAQAGVGTPGSNGEGDSGSDAGSWDEDSEVVSDDDGGAVDDNQAQEGVGGGEGAQVAPPRQLAPVRGGSRALGGGPEPSRRPNIDALIGDDSESDDDPMPTFTPSRSAAAAPAPASASRDGNTVSSRMRATVAGLDADSSSDDTDNDPFASSARSTLSLSARGPGPDMSSFDDGRSEADSQTSVASDGW